MSANLTLRGLDVETDLPAAKFLASPEAPGVEQAEQVERIFYVCAEFTYGLGREVNSKFNQKFLDCQVDILGNECPGKITCDDCLFKTRKDIQDVDHTLQRHFTMSKQGMLVC